MTFPSIRIEGGLLAADLLDRIESGAYDVGQRPGDFGLAPTDKVKDEIASAWAAARAYWSVFRQRLDRLPAEASGTSETRGQWMLPLLGLLGYSELEYQRQSTLVDDKSFPVSHRLPSRDGFPVHIVGAAESLDKRPAAATGLRASPHALVQEYLNRTDHLYGLVSNGRQLRLLRDSSRLTRLSFIEFDLERIFDEELFSDFALLFRLIHVSRLPRTRGEGAESLVERYHQDALDSGTRIRDGLSKAVEACLVDLANGFLNHPSNTTLRDHFASPAGRRGPKAAEFYAHVLRLIYRFLFLMVIEERGLVFPKETPERLRTIYDRFYSLTRLRRLSETVAASEQRLTDAWAAVLALFRLFDEHGLGQPLGVAPLGGDLFRSGAIGLLGDCQMDNAILLRCLRQLSLFKQPSTGLLMRVNYAALNVEEFGSVYQGLLEYDALVTPENEGWRFGFAAGDQRSRTGSHFTPEELAQPLLKHSLDYLIADALNKPTVVEKERTLLALKVCDLACGSGHILLAAARRIGTALAVLRTGDDQPSPTAFREAVRDVIRHCIYGMDLNPLAVELCKVALWLEAHVPGEPLSFLDHRIHCGNAIVGLAHAEELQRGIPTEAFRSLVGDDKAVAAALRKRNTHDRRGHAELSLGRTFKTVVTEITAAYENFERMPERGAGDYFTRQARYEQFRHDPRVERLRQLADLQVAQFFLPKTAENEEQLVTHSLFRGWLDGGTPSDAALTAAAAVAGRKRFGHWFIDFWDVVSAGGFDLIIGNPPYLGGQSLSGSYGHPFCEWVKWEYAPAGLSDLVVFFLRRIYDLLRPGGFTALITTNSIKDGDNRRDGLDWVVAHGGAINMAVRGTKWPGQAKVVVSLVTIHRGLWPGTRSLDGKEVATINSYFEALDYVTDPVKLLENEDKIFQGVIFLGDGFLLTGGEAARMCTNNPRCEEVVFPIINGQELNNRPDQTSDRRIINFFDWPVAKAAEFGEAFQRIEDLVRPVRQQDKRAVRRERWWQYAERATGLYRGIRSLTTCFITSRVTKYLNFSLSRTDIVFSNNVYVLTSDRWEAFATVQSTIHEVWARKYSMSLKQDLQYSPSDCFQSFPFPHDPAHETALATIGETYHEHRRALMRDLWFGLTDLYNLFHLQDLSAVIVTAERGDRATISGDEGHTRLLRLRELHVALDTAVLAAYGWDRESDFGPGLALRHDFYALDGLPENDRTRFTIHPDARREVLTRLLKLNHLRAAQEEETGARVIALRPSHPAFQFPTDDLPLFRLGVAEEAATPTASEREEQARRFNFTLPSGHRPPESRTTAGLFSLLLPALVQEAEKKLKYPELIAALNFLSGPPASPQALPESARPAYPGWRKAFPPSAVDPAALRAALDDLIVHRQVLNLRPVGDTYEFFPGPKSLQITAVWPLLDARLALAATWGAAAKAASMSSPTDGTVFLTAVPPSQLEQWAIA